MRLSSGSVCKSSDALFKIEDKLLGLSRCLQAGLLNFAHDQFPLSGISPKSWVVADRPEHSYALGFPNCEISPGIFQSRGWRGWFCRPIFQQPARRAPELGEHLCLLVFQGLNSIVESDLFIGFSLRMLRHTSHQLFELLRRTDRFEHLFLVYKDDRFLFSGQ